MLLSPPLFSAVGYVGLLVSGMVKWLGQPLFMGLNINYIHNINMDYNINYSYGISGGCVERDSYKENMQL